MLTFSGYWGEVAPDHSCQDVSCQKRIEAADLWCTPAACHSVSHVNIKASTLPEPSYIASVMPLQANHNVCQHGTWLGLIRLICTRNYPFIARQSANVHGDQS